MFRSKAVMAWFKRRTHRCAPKATGRRVIAEFGKDNLPKGLAAAWSSGDLAVCECGKRFILHDPAFRLPQKRTELIGIC